MKIVLMTVMTLMVATVGFAGDYGVQFSCVVEGNNEGFHVKAINNGPHNLKCKTKVETVPPSSKPIPMPEDGAYAAVYAKKDVLQPIDSKYGITSKISECRVIEPYCELQ